MVRIKRKDKKALSVMIGYILLISFGIVLSIIVYSYLKTYVPKEFLECPDGVSIFIEDINCSYDENNDKSNITITLQNNGKFNLAGYFIYGTNDSSQDLATTDLSEKVVQGPSSTGPISFANSVIFKFDSNMNTFKPGNETIHYFTNITSEIIQVEIIPIRYDYSDSTQRIASCGDSKVLEFVSCDTQ